MPAVNIKTKFAEVINNLWVFWSINTIIIYAVLLVGKVVAVHTVFDIVGGLMIAFLLVYPVWALLYALYKLVKVFINPLDN